MGNIQGTKNVSTSEDVNNRNRGEVNQSKDSSNSVGNSINMSSYGNKGSQKEGSWIFGTLNVRTLGADIQNAEGANYARLPLFSKYFLSNNIKVIAMQETRIQF